MKNHVLQNTGEDRKIAVFTLTAKAHVLAKGLAKDLKGAVVYPPQKLKAGGLRREVKKAFKSSSALIFVCATGIAVRSIAPHLTSKHLDPAVIVIDESGRFAISLVSGHLGGANALAEEAAKALGAVPIITTATDSRGLPCVEEVAQKAKAVIEDVKRIKLVNSALLGGVPVFVVDEKLKRLAFLKKAFSKAERAGALRFIKKMPLTARPGVFVIITSRANYPLAPHVKAKAVFLRPKEIVIGIGCKKGVTEAEVGRFIKKTLNSAGLSLLSVRNLASIDVKKDERGILEYAAKAGLEAEFYCAKALNTKKPPSGISLAALKNTGAMAVAENAALLSSGAKKLCIKKIRTRKITLALALTPFA